MMKPTEAKKYLKEHGVKYVLAQFVDVHGAAKAKSVPVEHYDTVITDGAGFAGFALAGMGMKPNADGDFMAVGDPSTLSVVPWQPGYARMASLLARCTEVAAGAHGSQGMDFLHRDGTRVFASEKSRRSPGTE
jgi:glutamine synthetase